MLIPAPHLYEEALERLSKSDLPVDRTLDMITREALRSNSLYVCYREADPEVIKALAHGVLLGLSIATHLRK